MVVWVLRRIYRCILLNVIVTNGCMSITKDLPLYYIECNYDEWFYEYYEGSTVVRGVHGSVRFGLDSKNQPNRITLILWNINRTGPKTGSNRTGPVRLHPVFFGKKPGNLIPSSRFFIRQGKHRHIKKMDLQHPLHERHRNSKQKLSWWS